MKAYAYNNAACLTTDLTLTRQIGGTRQVVLPHDMVVQTIPDTERYSAGRPTFSWDYEIAESIFQSLWDAGYRPAKGQGGAAEVEALKNHIAFAERIAEKTLDRAVQPPVVIRPRS